MTMRRQIDRGVLTNRDFGSTEPGTSHGFLFANLLTNFKKVLRSSCQAQATIEYMVLFIVFALACASLIYCANRSDSQNRQWSGPVRNVFEGHFDNMAGKILN